jgi:hypothetical protein
MGFKVGGMSRVMHVPVTFEPINHHFLKPMGLFAGGDGS